MVKLGAPADWAKKPHVGIKVKFGGLFILLMESDHNYMKKNYILTCEWYAVKNMIHTDELQWKWFCRKKDICKSKFELFYI